MSGTHAVRHYSRGSGHECETATLSYLESSGFVKVYHSDQGGRMEREVNSFGVASIEEGRVEFGREHNRLLATGWTCVATNVTQVE